MDGALVMKLWDILMTPNTSPFDSQTAMNQLALIIKLGREQALSSISHHWQLQFTSLHSLIVSSEVILHAPRGGDALYPEASFQRSTHLIISTEWITYIKTLLLWINHNKRW